MALLGVACPGRKHTEPRAGLGSGSLSGDGAFTVLSAFAGVTSDDAGTRASIFLTDVDNNCSDVEAAQGVPRLAQDLIARVATNDVAVAAGSFPVGEPQVITTYPDGGTRTAGTTVGLDQTNLHYDASEGLVVFDAADSQHVEGHLSARFPGSNAELKGIFNALVCTGFHPP